MKQKDKSIKEDVALAAANDIDEKMSRGQKRPRMAVKIVALGAINLLLLVAIFYFLAKLPEVSENVKSLRSKKIASQETTDIAVLASEINKNSEKTNELQSYFVDLSVFTELLAELDNVRSEGVLTGFDFPGSPVKGATGHSVLPVSMVFQGSQDQVNAALREIFSLPFLIEPKNVEIEGDRNAMVFRFFGVLYINEHFPGS